MEVLTAFIKKYPAIDLGIALILFLIPFAMSGDSVISKAMIQAGWCGQGDYICLSFQWVRVFVVIFVIVFLTQIIVNLRIPKRIQSYLDKTRPANFIVTDYVKDNEIYIGVYNQEFWLCAKLVYATTEFAAPNWEPISGHLKWIEDCSKHGSTSIYRKNANNLDFATINKENRTITLHLLEGDSVFPYPQQEKGRYGFPVFLMGEMLFFKYRVKSVVLNTSRIMTIEDSGNGTLITRVEGNID